MWRPELGDYLAAAAVVLGTSADRLERLPRLSLAESALAAPFAGFGGQGPIPASRRRRRCCSSTWWATTRCRDGNKRVAFLVTVDFLELNGRPWLEPDFEVDGPTVERVAIGEVSLEEITAWVRRRTEPH